MTFGEAWSRALVLECDELCVEHEWALAVFALESDFNPHARSQADARGLWQRMPRPIGADPNHPPPGSYVRTDKMGRQTVWMPYLVTDPIAQLQDGFAFWTEANVRYNGDMGLATREAFYCLNFAPARLSGGHYSDDTPIYSCRQSDGVAFWVAGYKANAKSFGLDPDDTNGRILMRDLAIGLDAAVLRNRARYDAELSVIASLVDVSPTG